MIGKVTVGGGCYKRSCSFFKVAGGRQKGVSKIIFLKRTLQERKKAIVSAAREKGNRETTSFNRMKGGADKDQPGSGKVGTRSEKAKKKKQREGEVFP